jgi:hypothetical protein
MQDQGFKEQALLGDDASRAAQVGMVKGGLKNGPPLLTNSIAA